MRQEPTMFFLLPGFARQYSGLDVHHFCKTSSVQYLTKEGLESIGDIVETLATAEGLPAHAQSVSLRLKGSKSIQRKNGLS